MKTPDADDLSGKLQAWSVDLPATNGFQREVWQRIAARQAARERGWWPQAMRWLFAQMARPGYATGLALASVSLSIGLAHVQARETNAKQWKALEARYAASIDPLAMAR